MKDYFHRESTREVWLTLGASLVYGLVAYVYRIQSDVVVAAYINYVVAGMIGHALIVFIMHKVDEIEKMMKDTKRGDGLENKHYKKED